MLNLRQIIHHFFKKEELEQVSEEDLRKFVELYPYSTAGHLLLAKKLKEAGDKRAFEKEISSTALYFNNPVWLEWLMKEEDGQDTLAYAEPRGYYGKVLTNTTVEKQAEDETSFIEENKVQEHDNVLDDVPESGSKQETEDIAVFEPVKIPDTEPVHEIVVEKEAHSEAPVATEPDNVSADKEPAEAFESSTGVEEQQAVFFQENIREDELPQDFEPLIIESNEHTDYNSTHTVEEDQSTIVEGYAQTAAEEDYPIPSISRTSGDDIIDDSRVNEEPAPYKDVPVSGQSFSETLTDNPVEELIEPSTSEDVRTDEIENGPGHTTADQTGEHPVEVEEVAPALTNEISDEEESPGDENASDAQPELTIKTSEKENLLTGDPAETISFEPYHTIDYFASQGIKLKQDELNRDKLGQQLKSFTDWLRSMKKVPGQMENTEMDENAQVKIQQIAKHSVEEKEVLTEAMAEVWAKQGNRQKAIVIYQKLSLQNPDKSAYFAAKIDQLNAL